MTALGLREGCPDCGNVDCERTCPAQAEWQDSEREAVKEERLLFNAAVHGVESFLLALACEGIKVDGGKFKKALETVLDKLGERYD
jgi:predicted  nucleic acid-binding Zn-ribbon protein